MPQGFCVWLTGLSGAGKTTLARLLEQRLLASGRAVEILDGDVVRTNLSKGLGFSREDREENIRRVGFVCELLARNGVATIAALISPYREARDSVRRRIPNFIEVHLACPLDVLIQRDVKGLYKEAMAGRIPHFTGISDPYEAPLDPDVMVDSAHESPAESVEKICACLVSLGLLEPAEACLVGVGEAACGSSFQNASLQCGKAWGRSETNSHRRPEAVFAKDELADR